MAKVLIYVDGSKAQHGPISQPEGLGVDLATASNWSEFSGLLQGDSSFDLVICGDTRSADRSDLKRRITRIKDVPVIFMDQGPTAPASPEPPQRFETAPTLIAPAPGLMPAPVREPESNLEKSRRFMDENFLKPLTLEEIARVAGISPSYFCRKFKDQFGMSPITYLKELRLNRACHLLAHTNLPLAEVTAQSGFFSIPYFCREFKKSKGESPIQHRREMFAQHGRPTREGRRR